MMGEKMVKRRGTEWPRKRTDSSHVYCSVCGTGTSMAHRLKEGLGELRFEGMRPGEMYRLLWQMEQEGMVLCNREGGGFSVPQRCHALTEGREAYRESYAGLLSTGKRRTPSHCSKTSGSGGGGAAGEGRGTSDGQSLRKSSSSSCWLIAKNENGRIAMSAVRLPGVEVLAVFGHEEETELYLWLEVSSRGWRIRVSSAGEVISVLYGACKDVEKVVLDPPPRMLPEKTIGLARVQRGLSLTASRPGRGHSTVRSGPIMAPKKMIDF
jgi:hypothetical protein